MDNQQARGWIIDPVARKIESATLTWDGVLKRIGADYLERVRLPEGGELWVDEEGMVTPGKTHWVLGRQHILAGAAFLCGDEWTDYDGASLPKVAWLQPSARVEVPRARAYPMTAAGLAAMQRDAKEAQGHLELAAVGAEPAVWPIDGQSRLADAPQVGDFATDPDGFTGMIIALDGEMATIRFIDGREMQINVGRMKVANE